MGDRGQAQAQWVPICTKFPATLNKSTAPELLDDGQTPDAYNLGLERPGWLYFDASPTVGVALASINAPVTNPTGNPFTSGDSVWFYFFNRLWGFCPNSSTAAQKGWIVYGSPGNSTVLVLQDNGILSAEVNETNSATTGQVIGIVPRGNDMDVLKAGHLFTVRNAANPGGPGACEYVADQGVSSRSYLTCLDGVTYFSNTAGVFSFDGQNFKEVSAPVRASLSPFHSSNSAALYVNHQKHRVNGQLSTDVKYVIDGLTQALYDFDSGTTFRFTSPSYTGELGEPLAVDALALCYECTATTRQSIGLDVKINDTWTTQKTFSFVPTTENGRCEIPLDTYQACRKWAFRLTSLPSSFYISKIVAHVRQGGIRGYSNK